MKLINGAKSWMPVFQKNAIAFKIFLDLQALMKPVIRLKWKS
jgi:hypothetical protein